MTHEYVSSLRGPMKYYLTKLVVSLGLAATVCGQTGNQINLGGNQVTGILTAPKGGSGTTPGTSLPATPCTNGKTFIKTSASPTSAAFYACIGTAWVLQSGGGSVTSVASGCGTSGGPITATGTLVGTVVPKSDATAAYTFLNGDCGKRIIRSNSGAMGDTLPNASDFDTNWYLEVHNNGPGAETITATVSTFQGGAAAITLYEGQFARIVRNGADYSASGQFVLCPTCAGAIQLAAGTAPTIVANTVSRYADTSVVGYKLRELAAACTGILLVTNTANDMVTTCLSSTGTGAAVRANSPVIDSPTITGTCVGCTSRSSITSAGLGYYAPWGQYYNAGGSITANVVVYQQFVVPFAMTVSTVGIYLGGLAASNSVGVSIMDSSCNLISGATGRFTGPAGSGAQAITLTTPDTLIDVGVYYFGLATEDATATIANVTASTLNGAFNLGTDRRLFTGANAPTGSGATGNYTMPASCGAKTVSTNPILFGVLLP